MVGHSSKLDRLAEDRREDIGRAANPKSTRPIHNTGVRPNKVMVKPHAITQAAMALP